MVDAITEGTSRCAVQTLERLVGTPDFPLLIMREMQERQHVITGGIQYGCCARELLPHAGVP